MSRKVGRGAQRGERHAEWLGQPCEHARVLPQSERIRGTDLPQELADLVVAHEFSSFNRT